jgi:hypothetical protein
MLLPPSDVGLGDRGDGDTEDGVVLDHAAALKEESLVGDGGGPGGVGTVGGLVGRVVPEETDGGGGTGLEGAPALETG